MCLDARADTSTRRGAIARIAKQTNVHKEALRNWVSKAEAADIPTEAVDAETRIRQLEAENRELRMKAEFLGKAAAFFAQEHR